MKRITSIILVTLYRVLCLIERCLPLSVFRAILAPLVWLILKRSQRDVGKFRANYENRMDMLLLGFSQRLIDRRWSRRCEFTASDSFKKALARQERVVLLFLHQGPFQLLPYWLRAFGVKVSLIAASDSSARQLHKRWRDRRVRFPDQKVVWHRDELKGFINLLSTGGILLMAIDTDLGKQTTIEMDDGRTFRLANGPLRLAERHGCCIFPCGLESLGGWRFRLRIGDKHTEASSQLIQDLLNCYETNVATDQVLSRFTPPDIV